MPLLDEYMVGVDGPWSDREAAHLWRRAGFGARPDERAVAVGAGDQQAFRAAVDALVLFQPDDPNLDAPTGGGFWGGPLSGLPDDESDEGRTKAPPSNRWLRMHLLYRMIFTSQPLQEQFALFLHDHLVSDYEKTHNEFEDLQGSAIETEPVAAQLLLDQHALFRRDGLNSFRDLLVAVTRNPAMLLYLDNFNNGAGEGRAQENYAREVMELFSMGVGNYSEDDVREIAKALTGEGLPYIRDPGAPDAFDYEFRSGNHEPGDKTVFGQVVAEDFTGQETIDVIDMIMTKRSVTPDVSGLSAPYNDLPATAVYMSWKLLRWFVSNRISLDPPDPAVLELADYMRGTDDAPYPGRRYPYDMQACLGRIFGSRFFYDIANRFAVVKTPADFVVSGIRALNMDYDRSDGWNGPGQRVRRMGMDLYQPPTVAGWDHGLTWINAGYLVERYNYLNVAAGWWMSDQDIEEMMIINGGFLDPDDDPALLSYFRNVLIQDDLETWAPGSTDVLTAFMDEVNENNGNSDRRFREKVRGLIYLLQSMPIAQMK